MRLFSRPSHYQIAFLLLFVGVAWSVSGGQRASKKELNLSNNQKEVHKGFVRIGTTKSLQQPPSSQAVIAFKGRVLGETPQSQGSSTATSIPLPRVKLELVPLGKGGHSSQGILSVVSNQNGRFQVSNLIPGKYMLRALPNDGIHVSKAIALEISANPSKGISLAGSPRPTYNRDVLLPLPRKMLGHLKTSPSAKKEDPDRSGFWISVSENGLHRGTAKTDQEGAFQLNAVGTGPYDFTLRDQDGEVLPIDQTSVSPDPAHHKVLVSLITPQ